MKWHGKWLLRATVLVTVFVSAAAVSRSNALGLPPLALRSPLYVQEPRSDAPEPGTELAFLFVDSPTCIWCNTPELPAIVAEAKRLVREQALALGSKFATVGLSRSSSAKEGIEHLARFGAFDELASGRRWYNTGLLKYVSGEFVGPPATPQVIVVRRVVQPALTPGFADEVVLLRQVGFGPIKDWVVRGAPVPGANSSTR
jgi:hypothetical protein